VSLFLPLDCGFFCGTWSFISLFRGVRFAGVPSF
jgi:hypothetical protein